MEILNEMKQRLFELTASNSVLLIRMIEQHTEIHQQFLSLQIFFTFINLNCILRYLKPLNIGLRFNSNFTDKCSFIKCQNGGTCIIRNGKAACICGGRFGGDFCEVGK